MANYNITPYYDTTEEEYQKNYKRLLGVPGRNLQAREVTVLQGLTLKHLESLSKSLFSDGYIIEGCELIVNGTTATITQGKIFAGGLIHNVSETNITISGTGTEIIGMKLSEEIVTENEDSTLRDPAQGYVNYSHPGAHRVKTTINFVVNDDTAIPLWTLIDGIIQTNSTQNTSDLMRILAERTYDESGNYRVYGLDVSYSKEIDANTIELMISSGKAYVEGWQILRPANDFIELPKSLDYRTTLNEPHTYIAGTDLYKLIHQPVKNVITVTATVQVGNGAGTGESVVKGVPGSSDPLAHESVTEIVEVWDSAHGTYTQGTDYILSANSVDWSPNGNEPAQGNTYYVTYKYLKNMEEGTDFQLTEQDNEYYIDFSVGGDNPVENTVFMVDYNWYLARYDIIYLTKDNNIGVIYGKSDAETTVKPPDYFINVLPLALVYLPPNSTDLVITNYDNYRLSMEDLHQLYQRVIDNEYDIANLDLVKEIQEKESSIYLRGILADNFITLDRADIGNTGFTANMNLVFNYLQLAYSETFHDIEPNETNTTATISAEQTFSYIPYTDTVAINQSYATQSININPYANFQRIAIIKTNPARYYWTKNQYYDRNVGMHYTTRRIYSTRWRVTHNITLDRKKIREYINTFHNIYRHRLISVNYLGQRLLTFVPNITVTITGENFLPNSDNLTLYVNNNKVDMTALPPAAPGTEQGTIKSDSEGKIKATFVMPDNTPTGDVNIEVKNDANISNYVFKTYGILKSYRRNFGDIFATIMNIVTERYRYRQHTVDPIAQTFVFDRDTFIDKVDLYFETKSDTEPLVLQIRGTDNGYPSKEIFYEKLIQPSEINISTNSSIPTTIEFEHPVYCLANKEYAITLTTTSNEYKVWIAKGGENDIITNSFVGTQPYAAGVLFASSNNSAWTALQDSDLKFKLYKAAFTDNTDFYLYFNELTGLDTFSRFILNLEYVIPLGTDITWEYSIDSGTTWTMFYPNDEATTDIGEETTKILIRAKLKTTDPTLTPIIRISGASITTFLYDTIGDYLTITVDTEQYPYSEVKVTYKAEQPSGTTITPYFSPDSGTTWKPLTLTKSYQVDNDIWQYEYLQKLLVDPPNISSSNATVDSTAGSLADSTTYYYIFTATNSQGETVGSAEFSVEVNTGSATNSIVFDLTNVFDSHATGFKVYRSTTSGTETLKYIVAGTPTSWTDDGSDTNASSDVPPTNNSALYTADSFKGKLSLTTASRTITPKVYEYVAIFKEAIP